MLSDNIRKYRKSNNMSQDELAEKLAVTRKSVSLWETGQTQPSLDSIVALAKLFNVSTDDLLADDKPETVGSDVTLMTFDSPKKNKTIVIISIACLFTVIASLLVIILLWKGGTSDLENNSGINSNTSNTESINSITSDKSPEKDDKNQTTSKVTSSKQDKNQSVSSGKNNSVSTTSKTEEKKDIYGYLKNFVIQNGTVNGDYCYVSKPADNYGGYSSEDFSLYYWGDTDKIEFCLHSVINDTFSINFYLYVPKTHTGNYEYITSYYYRDNGESLYEAKGTINAGEFTDKYPLNCNKYIGSTDKQNEFMEVSRAGICDLIACLEKFIEVEKIKYSFEDFGFTKF